MKHITIIACCLLAGCAYMKGPCSISVSDVEGNAMICEAGGEIILLPGNLEVLRPVPR